MSVSGSQVSPEAIAAEAARLETRSAQEILEWALGTFGSRVCLACSFGAEDMVILHLAASIRPGVDVFYLDTGLLFEETYRLIEEVRALYPIHLIRVEPSLPLQQQARRYGEALWERDPDRCCQLRKVEPLQAFLRGYSAWVTGIRRQQAPTRRNARVVEWDGRWGLVKVNPLCTWSREDVWAFIRSLGVPYNPLHDRGYPSIGCWPCTSPVAEGEEERAGRWRGRAKTECGLHATQLPADGRALPVWTGAQEEGPAS